MKTNILQLAGALALAHGLQCTASVLTVDLPEFTGGYFSTPQDAFPQAIHVGDFNFTIPAGEQIVGAVIRGGWGNSEAGSTAYNSLFLDGIHVATADASTPGDPYNNPDSNPPIPWFYTFSKADLAALADGHASFDASQLSPYVLQLDVTTLEITTVPEPATWSALTVAALAGLVVVRRFRAA